MFKVILDKGSKGLKEFQFETELGARNRAIALAELHRCKWELIDATFFVWAADWYA